jgi:hypothetical protein
VLKGFIRFSFVNSIFRVQCLCSCCLDTASVDIGAIAQASFCVMEETVAYQKDLFATMKQTATMELTKLIVVNNI